MVSIATIMSTSSGSDNVSIHITFSAPAADQDKAVLSPKQAGEAQMSEGEFMSFLFENFSSVTDNENLVHRLRLWQAELSQQKGE